MFYGGGSTVVYNNNNIINHIDWSSFENDDLNKEDIQEREENTFLNQLNQTNDKSNDILIE